MIRISLLIALLMLCGNSEAQDWSTPDISAIKKIVSKKKSDQYYPLLYARMLRPAETITAEEFKLLYYGYSFTPSYDLRDSVMTDKSYELLLAATTDSTAIDKLADHVDSLLRQRAIDPQLLFFKAYCSMILGQKEEAELWRARCLGIVDVIRRSGDGLSCKSSWHLLYPAHHIYVLESYDEVPDGKQWYEGKCWRTGLRDYEQFAKAPYFNVDLWEENQEVWEKEKADKRKLSTVVVEKE